MATVAENLQTIIDSKAAIKAAIEAKGVAVGDAALTQYASKIEEIEQGGGEVVEVVEEDYMDDVILIDFDGKVLYRYTAAEFMALTEMPPNPTHEYLTSLGWNWTLEEAHNYVGLYGKLTIGQDYKPTDGKTRLFITLDNPDFLTPSLNLAANWCNIDWGDGSVEQGLYGKGVVSHQYPSVGDYIITMESIGITRLGASTLQKDRCFGSDINNLRCLRKAYIGDSVYPNYYAFESCENLSQVTGTKITNYSYCYRATGLKALIYPRTYTGIGYAECGQCLNLKVVSMPGTWKTTYLQSTFHRSGIVRLELPIYPFTPNATCNSCTNLRHIIIPDGINQLDGNMCEFSRITELVIPNSVTKIGGTLARYCYNLKKIYIGSGVTDMNAANIFRDSIFLEEVHIAAVTPPTLQSTVFPAVADFTGTIYVPAESVEAYKTATNWSAYADKIVAEPSN